MGRQKFNFDRSKKQADKILNGNSGDDRFWSLTDIQTRRSYTMRFVPSNDGTGEEMFTVIYSHNFEYLDQNGKKRKYFGTCPSTYGKECPICQGIYDKDWWNGDSDEKSLASKYGRKKKILTNVLVRKDVTKPEMDGIVKLIRMSPQAFEKVLKQIAPSDADKLKISYVKFHPYNLDSAADFYLEFTPAKNGNFPNWSESEFGRELHGLGENEEETDKIFSTAYNISKYVTELAEKAKSNEEVIEKIGHIFDDEGETYIEDEVEYEEVKKEEVKKEEVKKEEVKKEEVKKEEVKDDDDFDDDDFDDFMDD
jgi:hypothetical protein